MKFLVKHERSWDRFSASELLESPRIFGSKVGGGLKTNRTKQTQIYLKKNQLKKKRCGIGPQTLHFSWKHHVVFFFPKKSTQTTSKTPKGMLFGWFLATWNPPKGIPLGLSNYLQALKAAPHVGLRWSTYGASSGLPSSVTCCASRALEDGGVGWSGRFF